MDEHTQWEKNVIRWSALLHDISKQGKPLFEGRDHVHPFNGAVAVLEIFNDLGVFEISGSKQKE